MPRKKPPVTLPATFTPPVDPEATVVKLGDPFPLLRDWMRHYATWLSTQGGVPLQTTRLKRAHQLAGYQVKRHELDRLEAREDFKQFLAGVVANDLSSARKYTEAETLRTMQQMIAMKDAAYEAGDYKEFFKYAAPFLERVWPKQEEKKDARTQVVVNIGSSAMAHASVTMHEEEAQVVDVEVISSPDDEVVE